MKKIVFATVFLTILLMFSTIVFAESDSTEIPTPPPDPYIVSTTGDYYNLSDTSVYITGHIGWVYDDWYADNGYCLTVGGNLEYWEEGSEEIIKTPFRYNWAGSGIAIEEYLTDLKPSTTYYYRASDGGETKSFTTLPYPQPKTTTELFKKKSYSEPSTYYYRLQVSPQSLTWNFDKIYIAFYKDDEFVGATIQTYNCTTYETLITEIDFDYAKVMVWDKDTMAPVTTPEIVYNTFDYN